MYKNAQDLMRQCAESGKRIWEIALENEMKLTGVSREKIIENFGVRLEIMFSSARKALKEKQRTKGGLIDGVAATQYSYSQGETLRGNYINYIMSLAYSCNLIAGEARSRRVLSDFRRLGRMQSTLCKSPR